MGCNKLFVTIHKNGLSNVSATSQQVREAGFSLFQYDVLAMHLRTIIRHAIDARHFRNGSLDLDESMLAAAREIKRDIDLTLTDLLVTSDKTTQGTSMQPSTAFGLSSLAHGSISLYDRLLLHIDGGPSLAKGIEHQKRLKKREEAASKLDSCIRAFNIKRGRSRRVPKKLLDRMQKEMTKAFQLTIHHKEALHRAFKAVGLRSHICHGEADPCLAKACLDHASNARGSSQPSGSSDSSSLSVPSQGKMAVITKDSDLLVYESIEGVLRPNPKGAGYILYEKTEVLKVLKLLHPLFLVLYGISLRNDYSYNVRSIGPVGSLELVHQVQDKYLPAPAAQAAPRPSSASRKGKNLVQPPFPSSAASSSLGSAQRKGKSVVAPVFAPSPTPTPTTTRGKHARGLGPEDEGPAVKKRIGSDPSADAASAAGQSSIISVNPQQSQPSPEELKSIRDLVACWCEKASAKIKKNVYATRFENTIQTFGFYSQLVVGEDPLVNFWYVYQFEPPLQPPLAAWPEDEEVAPEKTDKIDPDTLSARALVLLEQYAKVRNHLNEQAERSPSPWHYQVLQSHSLSQSPSRTGSFKADPSTILLLSNQSLYLLLRQSRVLQVRPKPIHPVVLRPVAAAAVQSPSGIPRRRKKGNKHRKRATSGAKRTPTDYKEKAPAGTGPKPSSATIRARKSAQEYEMRTLTVGSLAKNICSCLMANRDMDKYPFKSPEFFSFFREQRTLAEKVAKRIQVCVETAQMYQETLYAIIMLAIDDVKDPSRLKQQSQEARRIEVGSSRYRERLPWELPETYDNSFIASLLDQKVIYGLSSLIFYGKNRATEAAIEAKDAHQNTSTRNASTRKMDYSKNYGTWIFERYRQETGFIPFAERDIHILHAEATRSAASDVLEAIDTHYKYALFKDEAKKDIKWDRKDGQPAISWFQAHNTGQFADFVSPKVMARFVGVTEKDLFLFLSPPPKSIFAKEKDQFDEVSATEDHAGPSSSCGMEGAAGISTTVEDHAGTSSPRSTEGTATTVTNVDFVLSSQSTAKVEFAASSGNDNQEVLSNVLDKIFTPTGKTKQKARSDYILSKKGWFITQLLYDRGKTDSNKELRRNEKGFRRNDGYGRKVRLGSEKKSHDRPLELRTEFKTNGLVLQLVATDSRYPKKAKSKYRYHDDEEEEEDILEQEDHVEEISDEDQKIVNRIIREDAQYARDPHIIQGHYKHKHAGRSEVTDKDVKYRKENDIVFTQSGYECDLSARSELLANASQLTFPTSLKKVIGIDLGEIVTAAACLLDKDNPNSRYAKTIKRSYLYEPSWRFTRLLRSTKAANFIDILESKTPSRKHGGVLDYFNYQGRSAQEVLQEHFASDAKALEAISRPEKENVLEGSVREVLFRFYHSKWMLKKSWDARKASTQALDIAVNAIISLAGINNESEAQVIFAIGLAVFRSGFGPSSKHLILLKKLVKKIREAGHIAVGVHEYYTSSKCPRENCNLFLKDKGNRSKFCSGCNVYFDRDQVGSENIARVCVAFLNGLERPAKYKPAPPAPAPAASSS
ncbi:hypothetical protein EMPS_02873 [Entomortierella parvispora]|uniref:Cas12f1-like TNB domain-containing protein n=1 Tax=Entomortierella parvispora TaxID=205924 RepID=A0A9P3LU36_9FUNG|nr:hypothetical protein EMPS_02873 [Entomortierella parvispora]